MDGAIVSMESIGLSEYWLVCCPPWLQARYHHCLPSGSGTELFYLYRCFYHSSRGVWEHNYSVIMVVTTSLRHNLYRWPTNKWPLCHCYDAHLGEGCRTQMHQTVANHTCINPPPCMMSPGLSVGGVTCCNISSDDQTDSVQRCAWTDLKAFRTQQQVNCIMVTVWLCAAW